jgi:hypothetical protein
MTANSLHTSSILAIASIVMCATVRSARCDDSNEVAESISFKAESLIRGMLKERERIRSGLYHIRGSKVIKETGVEFKTDNIKGMCAFDVREHSFRFDSVEPNWKKRITNGHVAAAGGDLQRAIKGTPAFLYDCKFRYLRNQEYSAHWDETAPRSRNPLMIHKPGAKVGSSGSFNHLFDARACGVVDYFRFESGRGAEESFLDDAFNHLLHMKPVSVADEGELQVVVLDDEENAWKWKISINERAGFTPQKLVINARRDRSRIVAETTWRAESGVQVPVSFAYDWKVVNGQIDAAIFDYKSFPDIPGAVEVIDARGERPKSLNVFGSAK